MRTERALELALRSLEVPLEPGCWIAMPPRWGYDDETPDKPGTFYPDEAERACPKALTLLAAWPEPIEEKLLPLISPDKPPDVRYRAACVLVDRNCPQVARVMLEMSRSELRGIRYGGWILLRKAAGSLPFEIPDLADRYRAETEDQIKREIEGLCGFFKLKEIVPDLIAPGENRDEAIATWALGWIGDSRAVPSLIKKYPGANPHFKLEALARIGTPEAIEFVKSHAGEYGAAKALFVTDLELTEELLRGDDGAPVYLAIRKPGDPTERLLGIAESSKFSSNVRARAVRNIPPSTSTTVQGRLLALMRRNRDLRSYCAWQLRSSKFPGVEEALTDYAFEEPAVRDKGAMVDESCLIDIFNERWKTYFHSLEDVRARIHEVRKLMSQFKPERY